MKHLKWTSFLAAILILLGGCAAKQNDSLYGTLWVQTSAEYEANCLQVYNVAEKNIHSALNETGWTAALEQTGDFASLPPAVIMDIDDTLLDTSPYQAQIIIDGKGFSPRTWDEWLALKNAPAVPGAVRFIQSLKEKDIEVFYITNRECKKRQGTDCMCPQEQEVIDNLAAVGIDGVKAEHVLLKHERPGWSSEKKSRRESVAAWYRILMLFGDDLGDFLPGVTKSITPLRRDELVRQYRSNWGHTWYMLSNPIYGSWLRVLDDPKSRHLVGY